MEPYVREDRLTPKEPDYSNEDIIIGKCEACDDMAQLNSDHECQHCAEAERAGQNAFLKVMRSQGSRKAAQSAYLEAWKSYIDSRILRNELAKESLNESRGMVINMEGI